MVSVWGPYHHRHRFRVASALVKKKTWMSENGEDGVMFDGACFSAAVMAAIGSVLKLRKRDSFSEKGFR
jgi:hypothetical protein